MLYSSKNFIPVKEELAQYDDIFKVIIENHEEHCEILKPEEQANQEDRFEECSLTVLKGEDCFEYRFEGCSFSSIKFEIG